MSTKIMLNVYDVSPEATQTNDALVDVGLGLYHSGVEVHGVEYMFASGGGIMTHEPRGAQGARLRASLWLGSTALGAREVEALVARMRPAWPGARYNLLKANCNSFADALVHELLGHGIPLWVNRMSAIGSYFECMLPAAITGAAAPVAGGADAAPAASAGGGRAAAAPASVFAGQGGVVLGRGSSSSSSGGGSAAAASSASTWLPSGWFASAAAAAATPDRSADAGAVDGGSGGAVARASAAAAAARRRLDEEATPRPLVI